MSKTIDGIELLKMIKDGKIPYKTKINIVSNYEDTKMKFYTVYGIYRQLHLIRDDNGKIEVIRNIDTEDLLNLKFEIIEDEEEIDIQKIKELIIYNDETEYDYRDIKQNRYAINELVQAVKQLDLKINK